MKGKIPSARIIEDIAKELNLDPEEIREYRILRIQDYLNQHYLKFSDYELDRIDQVIGSVVSDYLDGKKIIVTKKKTYKIKSGSNWIDLTGVPIKYRTFLQKIYREIKTTLMKEEDDI
jgi:hypothetical protein